MTSLVADLPITEGGGEFSVPNGTCKIEIQQDTTEENNYLEKNQELQEYCEKPTEEVQSYVECIICDASFDSREQLAEHVSTHLKNPKLMIKKVEAPVEKPKSRSFATKRIRPYKNLNKNLISQVIEPEVNPNNPNYPTVPKLRILLPSQLSEQVDNAIEKSKSDALSENGSESSKGDKLESFMRPSSASSTTSSIHKSEMVESHILANESPSPKFPTESPVRPDISHHADLSNNFWGQDNESHTSSDSGIQIRESGEKEVERHDSLLQNFLNDTVNTKDPGMILPGPIDTEFMSLDRLAGPQCTVCGERYVDKASFEMHCKATGHFNPTTSSHNSLVPYGQNSMMSNPLDSLKNLPMQQLAQQVNRLHQNGPVQQNVLINIQQFGQPMPPHRSQYDMPPHMQHSMYGPQSSMYHPMGAQMGPQMGHHGPQMGPHVPQMGQYHPSSMYYPGASMYGPQHQQVSPQGLQHQQGLPRPQHPQGLSQHQQSLSQHQQGLSQHQQGLSQQQQGLSQHQQGLSQQQQGLSQHQQSLSQHQQGLSQHQQGLPQRPQHPQGAQQRSQYEPRGSMMPPRPPPPRMTQPQPRGQSAQPPRGPMPRGPAPRGRGTPVMRAGPPVNIRGQSVHQQRPNGPQNPTKITLMKRSSQTPPNQDQKKKRFDMLLPDTNDDADCHVISMQKCNDGMPVIKNVQGATTGEIDPIVHLTDSITLSVRNPKESPKEPPPQKKNDAKAVANILATRGITVTPATKPQKETQVSSQTQKQPTPVAINLNSAVSIIPTAKNQTQQVKNGSEKGATVDLTEDETPQSKSLPQAAKRTLPYTCDLCPAQYPTMKTLMTHRRQYHKAGPHGELGVPIVDLSQASVLAKLQSLGIHNYIPLPQSGTNGTFGMPIVSVNGARNPNVCNLGALGSGAVLTLGPLHHLSNIPANTNKQ